MSLLSRDQILAADDIVTERVPVPEWGGEVLVKSLTGDERDELEQSTIKGKGKKRDVNLRGFRARLLVAAVVDANKQAVFTERDVHALGAKSAGALERVVNVAQRLSGLSDADVDELVENFDDDPNEPSTSD